jgi:hypothetical protein
VGGESENAAMVDGRTLPLLQDSSQVQAYNLWEIDQLDYVVILDASNTFVTIFDVGVNNLDLAANREQLKSLLRDATTR